MVDFENNVCMCNTDEVVLHDVTSINKINIAGANLYFLFYFAIVSNSDETDKMATQSRKKILKFEGE